MRKTAATLARVAWLAICIVAIVEAQKGYQGTSDWRVEEGLAFEMLVLAFPASFLVVAGLILTGMVLSLFGLALPASSKPEMTVTWLLFLVAGYVQWFVIVPKFLQWRKTLGK